MAECTPGYAALAAQLRGGLDCSSANPVASFTAPWQLANWTLPVVELLMVSLALATLVHAARRRDATCLGLWFASLLYLFVLEPPLYFPDRFGMMEDVGLVFVHNRFAVQFLFDRMPLYIVALYPGLSCLAYLLVQRTGMLERSRPLVAASCIALVYQAFYELFDQLGPQLRWWIWNPAARSNGLMLASVPVTSLALFAFASPLTLAYLTLTLTLIRGARSTSSRIARVVATAVLTPLGMALLSVPYSAFGPRGFPSLVGQAVALWALPVGFGLVACVSFWRARRHPAPRDFGFVAGAMYLSVFALLWAAALPAYLASAGGLTPDGMPIGSAWYVVLCWLVAVVAVMPWRAQAREVSAPVVA